MRQLFASNTVSAQRTQLLINDMAAAGVKKLPAKVQDHKSSNLAKNLRRRMQKSSLWPKNYDAQIRVLNRFSGEEEYQTVPMLLPLELSELLWKFGDPEILMSCENIDPQSLDHLRECSAKAGVSLHACGLHCDGVPHSWDREESAEVVSINFPGLPDPWKNLRLPLLALPHSCFSEHTWDDLMEVIAWSFRCMHSGFHPTLRHDLQPLDSTRQKLAGEKLQCRSCLVEVRGDWKMLAETFHMPRWNTKDGICWSCDCRPDEVACTYLRSLSATRQPQLFRILRIEYSVHAHIATAYTCNVQPMRERTCLAHASHMPVSRRAARNNASMMHLL